MFQATVLKLGDLFGEESLQMQNFSTISPKNNAR